MEDLYFKAIYNNSEFPPGICGLILEFARFDFPIGAMIDLEDFDEDDSDDEYEYKTAIIIHKTPSQYLLDNMTYINKHQLENFKYHRYSGARQTKENIKATIVSDASVKAKAYNLFVTRSGTYMMSAYLRLDLRDELVKYCNVALAQINNKSYEHDLIQEGYHNIIKYGIAFYKKSCLVLAEK